MKVLVVEDNIPVRQTIADILQFMDHTCSIPRAPKRP